MTTPPVGLGDFKDFLNIRPADTTQDGELTTKLERAADLVEAACGPMTPRSVTERIRDIACDGSFQLQVWPVTAVTAVKLHSDQSDLDITNLDLDTRTGVVRGVRVAASVSVFYDVTYTAGRAVVPGPLCEATLVIGEQLWQTQRGPSGQPRFVASGTGDPGMVPVYKGFAWPNRAMQLVEPYRQPWVG